MFHVRAFRANGTEILGNLDGQTIYRGSNYFRTAHYKALTSGEIKHRRVHHWQVDKLPGLYKEGKCIRIITNPYYRGYKTLSMPHLAEKEGD